MRRIERRDFAVIFLVFSKSHRDFADFYRDFNTSLAMGSCHWPA